MKKKYPFLLSFAFVLITTTAFAQYQWSAIANFGGGLIRYSASYFSLNGKGYVCIGNDGGANTDCWEYNDTTNIWTQKANFPGTAAWSTPNFSFDTVGYLVSGATYSGYVQTVYEYNCITNTWTQKGNFPGNVRQDALGFTIGNFGYLTCGYASIYLNDLWQYDRLNDSWVQKSSFPGTIRSGISGFVVNGKAFVGLGYTSGTNYTDIYQYDPTNDSWTQKATFPGLARNSAIGFALHGKGFMGVGYDGANAYFNDFYEYDANLNQWTQIVAFPYEYRSYPAMFTINNAGYVGTGRNPSMVYRSDFYKLVLLGAGIDESAGENVYEVNYYNNAQVLTVSTSKVSDALLRIMDASGKLIRSQKITGPVLNVLMNDLASGIYCWNICSVDGGSAGKFFKE